MEGRSTNLSATVKETVVMPKSQSRKKRSPRRVLALPDLEHAKTAVLNSLTSASGQRTYDHAIREFVGWCCSEPRLAFNRTVVLRYQIHLEHAIAKNFGAARVVPYLIDELVLTGPLNQFQHVRADHHGTLRLLESINALREKPTQIDRLHRAF